MQVVEQLYRAAFAHDTAYRPSESTRTLRSSEHQLGRETNLAREQ